MDITITVAIAAVIGLIFGSYSGATVWRLRAQQLVEDGEDEDGEPQSKRERARLAKLAGNSFKEDRSRCLECGHQLAWYDLLPLVSWLQLGGKCRYCKKKIGYMEPLMEIAVAVYFAASTYVWYGSLTSIVSIVLFVLWLACGVMLAILFAYDYKWFLLPDVVSYPFIATSFAYAVIQMVSSKTPVFLLYNAALSVLILSGLYFALWKASKGRWVGFGDVKLGLGLGLLLSDWPHAFLALFLANLLGCVIVIPGLLAKKLNRKTKVPFGPMLIAGFLLAIIFGDQIIHWYLWY